MARNDTAQVVLSENFVPVDGARSGDIREPSSIRRTLYSKPIFSSDTGQNPAVKARR